MSTDEKFNRDKSFGRVGEEVAWLDFLQSPKVRNVMDVREDEYFKGKDIDFLVLKPDNQILKVEVKTDYQGHKTGNIAFETKTNKNIGCLEKSEADWIYYYLQEAEESYLVNLPRLRQYIAQIKPIEIAMGDNAKGYLLKLADLEKQKIAMKRERRRNGS